MKKLLLLAIFLALSFTDCTGFFFHPNKMRGADPSSVGLKYEEVVLNDGAGPNLIFWVIEPKGKYRGTIIYLHGNAGNISSYLNGVAWVPAEGYRVVIGDYRGYGGSAGEIDVDGLYLDAARAVRFAQTKTKKPGEKLILFGHSLGGSVAIYTASREEFRDAFSEVIAEAPFASYREIAREKVGSFWLGYPFQWPLGFLVRDEYSPINVISEVKAPIYLFHGDADVTVPPHHSEELCAALKDRCSLTIVPGANHVEVFKSLRERNTLIEILGRAQL